MWRRVPHDFSETHKRFLQLLDELNLKDDKIVPSETCYIYKGKRCAYDLKRKDIRNSRAK